MVNFKFCLFYNSSVKVFFTNRCCYIPHNIAKLTLLWKVLLCEFFLANYDSVKGSEENAILEKKTIQRDKNISSASPVTCLPKVLKENNCLDIPTLLA